MEMTIESFTESVVERLKEVLDGIYDVNPVSVIKNNDIVLHGIRIRHLDTDIAPIVYVESVYNESRDIEDAVQKILNMYYNAQSVRFEVTDILKYENVKSQIRCKLINYSKNREYLQDKVYIRFLDLAIVFIVQVYSNAEDMTDASMVVTKNVFNLWDISESQLYEVAKDNMSKYEEYKFRSIFDVLRELQQKSQITVCDREEQLEDCSLYVLTNDTNVSGACIILKPGVLEEVSKQLQCDLILIPSSIHEWLVLKKEELPYMNDKAYLYDMVREVNDTSLAGEDILSYSVYTYDRAQNKLCIL